MTNPKVSVIVPVYNVEKYLTRCLDSILSQTYKNIEVILVDDGSSDGSGAICDEYVNKDSRFKVIHKQNEGVSIARHTALKASTGDYVTFVDSDDDVSKLYVEKLLFPLINDNVDFTCCQLYNIYKNKIVKDIRTVFGRYEGENLKKVIGENLFYDNKIRMSGMPLYLWAKMFKKTFLKDGLKAAIGSWYGEDQVALLSMLYKVKAICVLPDYLYNYMHYSEQVTSKYRADKWDEFYRLWLKLLDIDKEHLIESKMPYRMWISSYYFYHDSIRYFETYQDYKKVTKHIFESALIRKYVFNCNIKDITQTRFEKFLFFLLKYKLYWLLYIEIKRIRTGLNYG